MKKRSYNVTKNRQNTVTQDQILRGYTFAYDIRVPVSMFHVSSEKIRMNDVLVNVFPILGPTNQNKF
jgi:hypothetical protein